MPTNLLYLLALPAVGLATWQAVEVLHHARLTLPLRRKLAAAAESGSVGPFLKELYSCPFCLSHWVAGALMLAWLGQTWPWCAGGGWLVATLAAVRLAQLGNDLVGDYCRTPKFEVEEEGPDVSIEEAKARLSQDHAERLKRYAEAHYEADPGSLSPAEFEAEFMARHEPGSLSPSETPAHASPVPHPVPGPTAGAVDFDLASIVAAARDPLGG